MEENVQKIEIVNKKGGLGVACFVLSIIGFLTGMIAIGLVFDVIAIILGIIAIVNKKQKKGLAIAGLIIALTGFLIMKFLISVFTGDSAETTSSSATKVDTIEQTESVEEVVGNEIFQVGDIIETDYYRISYISCEDYDYEYSTPSDGMKFIRLEFEVENIDDSEHFISYYDFNCYADDYEMSAKFTDNDLSSALSSGKKGTGYVGFEVPVDAENIIVEYKENMFSDDFITFQAK